MHTKNAVKRAAEMFGSQRKLGEALGVTTPLVNAWALGTKPVHPRFCYAIEIMTDGKVTAAELNPDVFDKTLIKKRIKSEKICHVEFRYDTEEAV